MASATRNDSFRSSAAPTHHHNTRSRAQLTNSTPQPKSGQTDAYYGHEKIAKICARFITHLFACPEAPPVATAASHAKLPYFIAYALHRTKLHVSVVFAALVLLQRLKARFPTARGSSGHRLFLSAFMIASKVLCDDTYSNKSWTIVGQNMFALREVNQMEREMCSYLEWELNVDPRVLYDFEVRVRADFAKELGPYPTYSLLSPKKPESSADKAAPAPPFPAPVTAPIPAFDAAPPPASAYSPPDSPDTPSPSYSMSTSPASTMSPQTPPGADDDIDVKIVQGAGTPCWSIRGSSAASSRRGSLDEMHAEPPASIAPEAKKAFAYCSPSAW